MIEPWTMLQKELAAYGINLLDNNICEYFADGQLTRKDLYDMDRLVSKEVKNYKSLMREMWEELHEDLLETGGVDKAPDIKVNRLFISSLKDLAVWLQMFEPRYVKKYAISVESALQRDSIRFSPEQKSSIIDYKINIDWVHRIISRLNYVLRLISYVIKGEEDVKKTKVVMARSVSGPWSNLDLPMKERVWKWWEEDENFRGRDRDIRNQRRYRKGLENYNKEEVGEGHYWREIRNEPYRWGDRDTESPYPGRNTLFWG